MFLANLVWALLPNLAIIYSQLELSSHDLCVMELCGGGIVERLNVWWSHRLTTKCVMNPKKFKISVRLRVWYGIIFVHICYVFVKLWTKTKPTKNDVLRLIQLFSQTLSDSKKQTSLWKTTYSKLLNDVYMSRHPHTPSRWKIFKTEIETFFDCVCFFRLGKTAVSLKNDLSREIMRGRCDLSTSNCSE